MTPHPTVKLQLMQPTLGAVPLGALPPVGFSMGIHALGAGMPPFAGPVREQLVMGRLAAGYHD